MKKIAIIGFNDLVFEVLNFLSNAGIEAVVFVRKGTKLPGGLPKGCKIVLLDSHDIYSLKKSHYEIILMVHTEDLIFSLACLAILKQTGGNVIFCTDKKTHKVLGECLGVTETICIEEVMSKILAEKLLIK